MTLHAAASTHVGHRRKANEDRYALGAELGFAAVADGMGGHKAGQVASELAARTLLEAVRGASGSTASLGQQLVCGIEAANRDIFALAQANEDLSGMGTTLVALLAGADRIALAHVGDSRAYLWRAGQLRLLTEDHSLVGELVRREQLSPSAAASHPHRHVLTRAVGVRRRVEADTIELRAESGDLFLLCSDGLTTHVADDEIAETLAAHATDLDATCDVLVEMANSRGGEDNTTVVVVRVE